MTAFIERFALRVADLDRSVRFYQEVMGLAHVQSVEIPGVKEEILGNDEGCQILLAKFEDQQGPVERGDGFWKMYIQTDEIETLYQRALDNGGQEGSAPQALPEYHVTVGFVLDPDGYTLELVQNDPA